MKVLQWSQLDSEARRTALARPAFDAAADVGKRVRDIVASVRTDGDDALRALTRQIDDVDLDALAVDPETIAVAGEQLTATQRGALERAAANIATFHEAQVPAPIDLETMPGVRCERVYRPIGRVGLYVPAVSAPLPSTALMLGIPARIAGCPIRILCSPPRADGTVHPAVLYAAGLAGIEQVFRIGGAQAVAAMAYGTESIPKVDKIFGPGNTWVTEAKEQVASDPLGAARDFPAGPSEVLVIADAEANADFVASDLLSQAEHGPDSQALLITTSPSLAANVAASVDRFTQDLSRSAVLQSSLQHASIIVVDSLETAFALSNLYSPEHLIVQVASPRRWLQQIDAAGSVFLGPWSPESMGDYCSGTNHVLPTYGYARNQSSLGIGDFLRSMTVQELSPAGLRALGPVAETLAALEGLDAHELAARVRRQALERT